MRKLLLLGGSSQQVIAIERAKEQGYYTVLCDYLPDNPGQYVADRFYLESTTDRDRILEIAIKERINGIVAYASDPAAPTAAYVAEKLGLPGLPYKVAECFCNKAQFRAFLESNGFNVPLHSIIDAKMPVTTPRNVSFPVVVKPVDSSGSKGVSVARNEKELIDAVKFAENYTLSGKLIVEEFIERDHKDVIEAEIFVTDGKVVVWGLMNSIRDVNTSPLLPAAYSYPLTISQDRIDLVKKEVSRLIDCAGIRYGAFNIEIGIDRKERLFFFDVGPRNGGNMLPEYISMIADRDVVLATVCAAMGDYDRLKGIELNGQEGGFWGLHVIHSDREGVFSGIRYSEAAGKYLVKEHIFARPGDAIRPFKMARDAVGLSFFRFDSMRSRDEIMNSLDGSNIRVLLES